MQISSCCKSGLTNIWCLYRHGLLKCGRLCCGLLWISQAAAQSVDVCKSYVVSKVLSTTHDLFDNLVFVYWTSWLLSLPADHQWKCYLVSTSTSGLLIM